MTSTNAITPAEILAVLDAPHLVGEYRGITAADMHPQTIPPGWLIGEDTEPSKDYAVVMGDPYDNAVCIEGTPAEIRAFVERLAATVATLPA